MADYVILIAGNICAGKTEFVKFVEEKSTVFNRFVDEHERVHIVKEFVDPAALGLFYRDRKDYSWVFEESCLNGRIARHLTSKHESGTHIFDRGMIEGAETFARNSYEEGYLSWDNYRNYLNKLRQGLDLLDRTRQSSWLEQLIVYLEVKDVRLLQERKMQRDTKGENIPAGYLQRINDLYSEMFGNITAAYSKYGVTAPEVIKIDASVDFNKDKGYHQHVFDLIKNNKGKKPKW